MNKLPLTIQNLFKRLYPDDQLDHQYLQQITDAWTYDESIPEEVLQYSVADKINYLLRAMQAKYHITGFTHTRLFFFSGTFFSLGNRDDWSDYYRENQLYRYWSSIPGFNPLKQKYLFYDDFQNKQADFYQKLLRPAEEIFNLCHGVCLFQFGLYYVDVFNFFSDKDNIHFNTQFLVNLHEFKDFIQLYRHAMKKELVYAKDNLRHAIKKTPKMPFVIKGNSGTFKYENAYKHKIKKVYFDADEIELSYREAEVLYYTCKYKKYKAVARKLDISDRTVEYHVNQMKKKFSCVCKITLIEHVINNGYLAELEELIDTETV